MNHLDLSNTKDRNLGRILQLQADAVGDNVYLLNDDNRFTFSETDRMVNSIARGLADLGVGRGDRVAFFANSALDVIFLTLAVSRLGAVWIPINAEYKGEWLKSTLADSKPKVIVSDTRLWPRLAEVIADVPHDHLVLRDLGDNPMPPGAKPFEFLKSFPDAPHDMSFIDYGEVNAVLWTSGTTGKSKGVMQSHNVWVHTAERIAQRYATLPGDVTYNVLPLYNSASWMMSIFRALFEGIGCASDPTLFGKRILEPHALLQCDAGFHAGRDAHLPVEAARAPRRCRQPGPFRSDDADARRHHRPVRQAVRD